MVPDLTALALYFLVDLLVRLVVASSAAKHRGRGAVFFAGCA